MAGEVARLMKLFGHPARIRIASALATDGPASPTVLSNRFGDLSVGDCNYHLVALRNGGATRIARSRKVRGACEQTYEIKPLSRWPFKGDLIPLITYLMPAMASPSEPILWALRLDLDKHGAAEATTVMKTAHKRATRIQAAAQRRLGDGDPADAIHAVLTIGLLDSAKLDAISS